jgi:hypothetical protein
MIAARYFISGWMVGQLHREQRIAMVLATTILLLGMNLVDTAGRIMKVHLLNQYHPSIPTAFWISMGVSALPLLLLPLFAVVGGMWGPGMTRQPRPRAH